MVVDVLGAVALVGGALAVDDAPAPVELEPELPELPQAASESAASSAVATETLMR